MKRLKIAVNSWLIYETKSKCNKTVECVRLPVDRRFGEKSRGTIGIMGLNRGKKNENDTFSAPIFPFERASKSLFATRSSLKLCEDLRSRIDSSISCWRNDRSISFFFFYTFRNKGRRNWERVAKRSDDYWNRLTFRRWTLSSNFPIWVRQDDTARDSDSTLSCACYYGTLVDQEAQRAKGGIESIERTKREEICFFFSTSVSDCSKL